MMKREAPVARPTSHVCKRKFIMRSLITFIRYMLNLAEAFDCEACRTMSAMVEDVLSPSFDPRAIPAEIWLGVFSNLEYRHLLRVSGTCKTWSYLCEDRALWRKLYLEAGLLPNAADRTTSAHPFSEALERRIVDWKVLFKQSTRLNQHWSCGKFTNFQLPHPDHLYEAHTDGVYAVQICGKFLVSGSLDRTVRVWDLETQRLVGSAMTGHSSGVLCLQCDSRSREDIILTGGEGGELISWRFSTRAIMRMLRNAHSAAILNVKFDTERSLVVTNSADFTIKVWDLGEMYNTCDLPADEPFRPSRTITGHQARVNAIDFAGDTLIGACADGTIKEWSISQGTCLKSVKQGRSLACIRMIGDRILCGGAEELVTVWDNRLEQFQTQLPGHKDLVRTVRSRVHGELSGIVASGSYDGSIILWNESTGRKRRLVLDKALKRCRKGSRSNMAAYEGLDGATHGRRAGCQKLHLNRSKWILDLDFDGRRLVCCSTAGIIAGWDFANNDFDILRCAAGDPSELGVRSRSIEASPMVDLEDVLRCHVAGGNQGDTQSRRTDFSR